MRLKRIAFTFKEPLDKIVHYQDQDVKQSEIMFADVEGIRVKVKSELNRVIRGINMVRILSPAVFDMFKFNVMNMERTFDRMINFEKINETNFEFIYPADVNALIQVKGFASRLGPLKKFALDRLKNEDLQLVKVLRDSELIQAFERFSFNEMQLEPGSWKISTDEFESNPEPIPIPLPTIEQEAILPAQNSTPNTPPSAEPKTGEHRTTDPTAPGP